MCSPWAIKNSLIVVLFELYKKVLSQSQKFVHAQFGHLDEKNSIFSRMKKYGTSHISHTAPTVLDNYREKTTPYTTEN